MSTGIAYQRWVDLNRDRRRESWRRASVAYRTRHKARLAQAWAARRASIFERDAWTCHYCRKDYTSVYRQGPGAPRIDAGAPGSTNGHARGEIGAPAKAHSPLGPDFLTLDHRIPRADGTKRWDPSNLLTSCWGCNRAKGKKSYDRFMAEIRPEEEPAWVQEP